MNIKDISFKDTYWSGEDNLIYDFYIPCLGRSISYDRAVGFFSSSIFNYISEGLYPFIMNNGKMRIICSTQLSDKDMEEIRQGYEIRSLLEKIMDKQIEELLLDKDKPNIKNLCWLIKNNRLDIRVCLKKSQSGSHINTLFHEKFGIFKDSHDNVVSFLGSINESINGWMFNEESFEVSYSWEYILKNRVNQKIERFEALWTGSASGVSTYEFPVAIKQKLIDSAPVEPVNELAIARLKKPVTNSQFIPRHCQKKAFEKFVDSDYICLYQMATGSGKTKAALYSLNNIEGWKLLLILAPSLELITQWEQDVNLFFPDTYVIKCGSVFGNWKDNLLDLIQAKIPERTVIISTYDSAISDFAMDKWTRVKNDVFAAIFDEAHNLGAAQTQKLMSITPRYRIGLSATPERNFDEEGTEKILNYFNNNTYDFPIRDAIREGYLVEYEYDVSPCILYREDWDEYIKLSKEISKLRMSIHNSDKTKENGNKSGDTLNKKLMARAEIIKTARNKLELFPGIFQKVPKGSRTLVYADSMEHLEGFALALNNMEKDYFIYTGDKDAKTVRPKMLEEFKLGIRKTLLAINCLDEGIDIPSCDAAIFVSSSTSERQFIQRRGRVLRKSIGKHRAYIYDYIVIPEFNRSSEEETKLAKELVLKEYRRIGLVADDAIDGVKVKNRLDELLETEGLGIFNY